MIIGVKQSPLTIVLKRLLLPISILLGVMSIGITGLMLIPGETPEGDIIWLSFLDALYITSYTASTIGFGEIPHPFNDNQKLWMLWIIYTSVITWLYNIGSILRTFQDKSLWSEINTYSFERSVDNINNEFYIILGFGRTGEWIANTLDKHGHSVVVLDPSQERISKVSLKKYNKKIFSLVADYSNLNFIKMAGIEKSNCAGVFIVGGKEQANKQALVICNSFGANTIVRAPDKVVEKEYSLAGATHVLNLNSLTILPIYNIFRRPSLFILASMLDEEIFDTKQEIDLPKVGKWAIWGRGKIVGRINEILSKVGNDVWVIPDVSRTSINEMPKDIVGLVVAGDDLGNVTLINQIRNNLGEIDIYTIAISEKYTLSELYEQIDIHLLIKPWLLFVEQAFTLISEPMIREMLAYLSKAPKEKTDIIVAKIVDIYVNNEDNANTWSTILKERVFIKDFIRGLGDERDHVLLYSKNNQTNFDDGYLEEGDEILIGSRYYIKNI